MKARSAARSTAFALAVSSICSFATGASAQQDETETETETETAPPKPHRTTASATETPPASESGPPPVAAKAPPSGIVLAKISGWELSIDGRLNAFVVYGFGNHNASTAPETGNSITPGIGTGITADNQIDVSGNFHTPRVRSGFVPNILAVNLRKNVTESTVLSGRVALWSDIHSNVSVYINAQTYVQEGYLKLEGPWGSFTGGRQLALFNRGAIEIDFNYGHNYGVGWPCNFNGVLPACGQIGYGALFPFFRAGLVYATPSLGGFQFTAGGMFKVFVNGVWQRLGAAANYVDPTPTTPNPPPDNRAIANKTVDQLGIAAGLRLELGPLRLGVTGHYGPGLGFYYAQENSQVAVYFAADAFDPHDGDLRTFRGFYGQLALVLGPVMIAGGAGASQVLRLPFDDTTANPMPKQNLGINAIFNYHIYDNFVWDLDYFRSESTWYGTAFKQTVNVVSSGFTMTF